MAFSVDVALIVTGPLYCLLSLVGVEPSVV